MASEQRQNVRQLRQTLLGVSGFSSKAMPNDHVSPNKTEQNRTFVRFCSLSLCRTFGPALYRAGALFARTGPALLPEGLLPCLASTWATTLLQSKIDHLISSIHIAWPLGAVHFISVVPQSAQNSTFPPKNVHSETVRSIVKFPAIPAFTGHFCTFFDCSNSACLCLNC
jgi:hypothetical protein